LKADLPSPSFLAGILSLRILLGDTFSGIDSRSPWTLFLRPKYKRSSVWPGIKAVLPTLFSGAKWVVGNGRQIPFWTGKWLDEPILTMLGLQHSSSSTMVDVVINNQQWALPNHFTTSFPDIANTITQVVLPASPTEDKLVWDL